MMATYELKLIVKDVEWQEFVAFCDGLSAQGRLLQAGSKPRRRKLPRIDIIGFKTDGRLKTNRVREVVDRTNSKLGRE